jgi:hypothetical protein
MALIFMDFRLTHTHVDPYSHLTRRPLEASLGIDSRLDFGGRHFEK